MITIRVLYFALVRERTGCTQENISIEAKQLTVSAAGSADPCS